MTTTTASRLSVVVAILNERGGRERNEDACGYWHSEQQLCCVLADGAGGHGGGEQAARVTVQRMLQACAEQPVETGELLGTLVRATNLRVREARESGTEFEEMYSTVVCLVIDFAEQRAWWAHAGDSRLYRFHGGRIVERTKDHSLVQSLVDAGLLSAADLRAHPQRSELRSALGTEDADLEVSHASVLEPLSSGDAFLMCTDGVWEHVDDAVLESTLAQADTPDAWLRAVEAQVQQSTRDKPRHDNFSAMAAWVDAAPPEP